MMRLSLLMVACFMPGLAQACACCAETGTRFLEEVRFTDFEREDLLRLGAVGAARLYLDACYFECVQGLETPQETYEAAVAVGPERIVVTLDDGRSRLSFPLGDSFTRFAVDPNPLRNGPTPELFTELRFQGEIEASGVFAKATGARADFILTGQANQCWNADRFTHWSLDVRGEGAAFRLFGQIQALR